jgi:hypothetical protein
MIEKIIIYKHYFIIILVTILNGCGGSGRLTDKELDTILIENVDALAKVETYCDEFEELDEVRVKNNQLLFTKHNYDSFKLKRNDSDKTLNLFLSLNIKKMDCIRDYENGKGELIKVRFLFLPKTFTLTGPTYTSIDHFQVYQKYFNEKVKENIIRPLSMSDWYIYDLYR